MVGTERQHSLPRWRFPPKGRGFVEQKHRACFVDPHVEIFDPHFFEIVGHTPCNSVHIVLHGRFFRNVAIIEGIVDVPHVFCQDFRL